MFHLNNKAGLVAGVVLLLGALVWGGSVLRRRCSPPGELQKATAAAVRPGKAAVAPEKAAGPVRAEQLSAGTRHPATAGLAEKKEPGIKSRTRRAAPPAPAERNHRSWRRFATLSACNRTPPPEPSCNRVHGSTEPARGCAECTEALKEVALIPAGEFQMGSSDGEGEADEHPRHTVELAAFYIDKQEVTVAQYKTFSATANYKMTEQPIWSTDRHPVVNVDWSGAAAYCNWAGGRLPTEAEWEKAARGGTGTKYSFDDTDSGLREHAWYGSNAGRQSHPVGEKKANQYGLYDMHGNVLEWMADWYADDYYSTSPVNDPKGPDSGFLRVTRGGSWLHIHYLGSADRNWFEPENSYIVIGFRCAASAGSP